jgi:carbon starvation protein
MIGFIVFFIGYRIYVQYFDTKILKSPPKKTTPAKWFTNGVVFTSTHKNIPFSYQFRLIGGAAPVIGPIIAIQWGWFPALLWLCLGALFIGWVHDYSSAVVAMRNEGASFSGLSYKLISPSVRIILLCFIYFFLLLVAGAFGAIVVDAAIGQKGSPLAWLLLTFAGVLAGQMIYRWKKDIILTTVVTVVIALIGIWLGTVAPSDSILGVDIASSKPVWAIAALIFCYFAAVLPIWRFALPINYVASHIVFLGLLFGIIGVFILRPNFTLPAYSTFTIEIGWLWPMMFVTIACGAFSGWHSIVSGSGTARQFEYEPDARPVGGGVMFVEIMLGLFALVIAGTIYASSSEYAAAIDKGPIAVFAEGVSKFLGAVGLPAAVGKSYGGMMLIVLAVTILQLVIRFMRVATSELLGDFSPIFKNAHIGTIITEILVLILILTGWWQYLWVLFGGANQLMASMALMLMTAWLMLQGKPYGWTFYPMIFMFFTTTAALVVTSYRLFKTVFTGLVKGPALVGNTMMAVIAILLVIAAIILAVEGLKTFRCYLLNIKR